MANCGCVYIGAGCEPGHPDGQGGGGAGGGGGDGDPLSCSEHHSTNQHGYRTITGSRLPIPPLHEEKSTL